MNNFFQFIARITSATKHPEWSMSSIKAEDKAAIGAVANFELLAISPEFNGLRNSISRLHNCNQKFRMTVIKRLRHDLAELAILDKEFLLYSYICLQRRFALFNEIERILPALNRHALSSYLEEDVTNVYKYLAKVAFDPHKGKNKELIFDISTRNYLLEIFYKLAWYNFKIVFSKTTHADKIKFYQNWFLTKKINAQYFEIALAHLNIDLNLRLTEGTQNTLQARITENLTQILGKSGQFIHKITAAIKQSDWSMTASQEMEKTELGIQFNFELLAATGEFRELSDAIASLEVCGLYSHDEAIQKLQLDLIELATMRNELLLDHYICLQRRLTVFNQMERLLPKLRDNAVICCIGMELTCIYYYLGVEGFAHNYYDLTDDINPKGYVFAIATRKYLLEIFTVLAMKHLKLEFNKMASEDKIKYYKDWYLTNTSNSKKLYAERKECFIRAIAQVENELNTKLSGRYKSTLLETMGKSTTKILLQEKLYLLEEKIRALTLVPEDYSRAQAVGHVNCVHLALMHGPFKLEDVHCALEAAYTEFKGLDDLLSQVGNLMNHYNGPRSMRNLKLAIDQVYMVYAQTGDHVIAREKLVSGLRQFRLETYTDHKAHGLGRYLGIFQGQSRLVHDLDFVLKFTSADNDAVVNKSKVTPGRC